MSPRAARTRGDALVELALVLPLLGLLAALPLAFDRWTERRLAVIDAARQAAWGATVAGPVPRPAAPGVRAGLGRADGGLHRGHAEADPPRLGATLAGLPAAGDRLRGAVGLYVLSPGGGTEAEGAAAVRRAWLGGPPGAVARSLLRAQLGADPIRLEFDALPEAAAR
jgi:TadE-like protein